MRPTYPRPSRFFFSRECPSKSYASVDRYFFKPCDTSWKDGIIALEAGERNFCVCHVVEP